jgi:hypothetical protein
MRSLLMLMAAASLFMACHNRAEEEVGAAPDRGDAAVTTAADTAQYVPADTAMAQVPSTVDTSSACSLGADTTMVGC